MTNFIGIIIPFIGTALGACFVFLLKDKMNEMLQKCLLGFAAGVMVAATVWSLLIPSIEMSESMENLAFVPAAIGFSVGIFFLLIMDRIIPHLHLHDSQPEGIKSKLKKTTMLIFAVTLHNIPEGMAVGVVFAGTSAGNSEITIMGAFALSVGIAIQNIPEGAIISLPLKSEGLSKGKAFLYGTLSGVVEPLSAAITILLIRFIEPFLPYILAFAAGAMIYVVVEELIPEASEGEHSNIGTIGFAFGFLIMMILDVALG